MTRNTVHGIDITAPGGIEALMAFHRRIFGDAVMEADDDASDDGADNADGAEGDSADADSAADESSGDGEESKDLGDKGKKALDAMKAKWRAAEKRAKTLEDEKASAGKPDDEKKLDQARKEAASEAETKANKRIVRAEIKAAAGAKFKDSADALAYLDIEDFDVDENGDVDEDSIAEALDDLLKKKPYLAAQGGGVRFDSARGKPKPAGQLTREQLKTMSPEAIEKARQGGRLASLLGT